MSFTRSACALALSLAAGSVPAAAQRLQGHAMGQALPSVITAGAVPGGGSLSEVTVFQPLPMGELAYGKGIVPFGTDDPMSRPFVRFPVNHHLAQIVERAEIATAWRLGLVGLEGAVFIGDEPENPGSGRA